MAKFVQLGGSNKPVGYCHYHKFTLSKNQLKKKRCLEKNCNRLQKYDVPYWNDREQKKQQRKERKNKLKKEQQKLDKKKLIKAIKYCNNCPEGKKESLEYCSACKYSTGCMSEIMKDIYIYLTEYDSLKDFLEDD